MIASWTEAVSNHSLSPQAVQINRSTNNAQHHFVASCQWRLSCRRNGWQIVVIWEKYLTTRCIGAITTASDQGSCAAGTLTIAPDGTLTLHWHVLHHIGAFVR